MPITRGLEGHTGFSMSSTSMGLSFCNVAFPKVGEYFQKGPRAVGQEWRGWLCCGSLASGLWDRQGISLSLARLPGEAWLRSPFPLASG